MCIRDSIDSVSDRDFAIDFLSAAATCAMHLSRLAEDFIIFNSEAFSFVEFTDKVLTGSSIMPQKKNPDPAELIRGRTAINYGNLNSMLTIMKGLPISYYKDLQDDKELVFDSYDTLKDSLSMSIELMENLNAKKNNMKNMAQRGYTTATDFADYLVKRKRLPFRKGYAISSKLVNYAERKKVRLDQLSMNEINKFVKKVEINIPKIFDVMNSMNSKTSFGGTASKNIKKIHIISPGFSSDCLETLEELEVQNKEIFISSGGEKFNYIKCLNDDPQHLNMLALLILNHMKGWPGHSK